MADDLMRQYFDAWVTVGQVTRERAEEIVRGLVEAGEVQREQFEAWVDRLLERAEANAQAVADIIRTEVANQLSSMGVVSRADVTRLDARLDDLTSRLRTAASAPARRAKQTAEKARSKGAVAKRAAARRGGTKKAGARKAATSGAPAAGTKKAGAKRPATSTAKRGTRSKKAGR